MKKLLVLLVLAAGCSHKPAANKGDAYIWLEDVEGKQALNWVETQNKESIATLTKNPNFKTMEHDALAILEAKDKIPSVDYVGKNLVNFWRDDAHVRGILRTTTLASYKTKKPAWKTIIDFDALAKKENENWIYKGMTCLEPDETLCMISLSRGGKDAVVMREFDMKKKAFITTHGFTLPEAKTMLSWVDKDSLLVGTDFGPGSLTTAGYPRLIKLWKRGTALAAATLVFEGQPNDVWAQSDQMNHGGKQVSVISRGIDFFNTEEYVYDAKKGEKALFPKPAAAELAGYFQGLFLYKLRNPWTFNAMSYPAGALVSIDAAAAGRALQPADVQVIFTPKANQAFGDVLEMKTKIAFSVLEDVKGKVYTSFLNNNKWEAAAPLDIPGNGNIILSTSNDEADQFLYLYENFNQASTLYSYNFKNKPVLLKSLPARFDAKDVIVDQKFAVSKDGTKVPYFLIYKKNIKFDGTAPTLQYGYGGFTVSQAPAYNSLAGKLWIEKGGVYVVANIRGGGEYGPAWHQAALKEKRQNAYDDFIAVSEDLIKNKITTPAKLAIRGGSNGGLLVGAVMVQRPDLYGAVLCGVPLLDMMRFNQLLAGASWMGEYGDPAIASNRAALMKYSPYQNVQAGKTYPPVFFFTSTKDDRVHPGHARKMAAKMKDQKHQVLYYENTEGGHAASANYKQQAMMMALQFQFLFDTISKADGVKMNKTAAGF